MRSFIFTVMNWQNLQKILKSTCCILLAYGIQAQEVEVNDQLKKRKTILLASSASVHIVTMVGLNELWYKDFPRSNLHSFNDSKEWLGMDKIGHATTTYHVGRAGYSAMQWAGHSENKSLWIGGNMGLFFQTGVELLDGTSAEWGFSWADMGANAAGSGLFIAQHLIWREQRIQLKFSKSKSRYAKYRPSALGSNWQEEILKDYNGQTYWASIHVFDFVDSEKIVPNWLMLSVGYGADGLLGANVNPEFNDLGMSIPFFERQKQWYLSLDVDLSRIEWKRKGFKTFFSVFGFLKIPAPALVLQNGNFTFEPIHF